MNEQTIEGLNQRLVRLEQQNRRFTWWGIALVVVFGAGLLIVQSRSGVPRKTVEAEEFVLRSADREGGAVLGFTERGPGITFSDKDEKRGVWLGLSGLTGLSGQNGSPHLRLWDDDRKSSVSLGMPLAAPWLILNHKDGGRLCLGTSKRGPFLTLCDKDDQLRVSLDLWEGESVFQIYGKDDEAIFRAP